MLNKQEISVSDPKNNLFCEQMIRAELGATLKVTQAKKAKQLHSIEPCHNKRKENPRFANKEEEMQVLVQGRRGGGRK